MASDVDLIKERTDIAQFIRGYVQLLPAGKNFKALCPFHKEKTPSFIVSPDRQSWHCFGCFPPGQKVKTPFGYHNIETIDTQHYVYSGTGEIRKVLATQIRNYRGELIDVRVRMLGGVVSLTKDHKVKIIRPRTRYSKKTKQFYRQCRTAVAMRQEELSRAIERYGVITEVPAGELQQGDFVLYPLNTRTAEVPLINLRDYCTKTYTFGPRPPELRYQQAIGESFLKLLGYWIAEGSGHRAYLRFSLGSHEEQFAEEIVRLVKELFNIEAKVHRRPPGGKTGLEISACHAYLGNIFENLCGKGAANKHIPFILQDLPAQQQMVLVDAIFRGDGTSFLGNNSNRRHKSITTVSRVLAEQLVDCLLRNGIFPHLTVHGEKVYGGVHHREHYSIGWSEEAKAPHLFVYRGSNAAYWMLPVRSVQPRSYEGPVYNLTVEKEHSYVATNFAVANCNTGGDVISFLMKYENLEFFEALKILAEKAGVDLRRVGGPDQKQYAVLYEVNRAAANFFKETLTAQAANAEAARAYLRERGLTDATVQEFELGFAANSSDALSRHLGKLGFAMVDIERAGLVFKTERGTYWDRFRNRIMFPLHNSFGKVIAFTGRIMPGAEAEGVGKYINSPETPIFSKSKLLFGFDKSKNAIREAKAAVLVEGQMDLLMAWQDGVKHVIATSGTALTAEHLKPLRRIAETLVVSFDNDEAGQVAIERTIDLASAHDFAVTVADTRTAGEGLKDPADIAKAKPGLLKEIMVRARPAMEFYFDRYLKRADDMASRKRNLRTVLQKIKVIASPVEQAHWVQKLSLRSGISETALLDEMRALKVEARASDFAPAQGAVAEPERTATRHERIAEALLAVAVAHPTLAPELATERGFFPAFYQPFVPASGAAWAGEVPADVTLRSSLVTEDAVAAKAEFSALIRELRREHYRIAREELQTRIREAETSGNEAVLADALREFDKCSREMHNA